MNDQNEEERDESEEKDRELQEETSQNHSKFDMNDTMDDKQIKTIDQNNRSSHSPSSNHIITSPTNTNSNAVWNTDSWADGEFEPIEPNSGNPISHTHTQIRDSCSDLTLALLLLPGNSKLDEARRKREEKKIQRQRELEARRVARGPLKLGAKKL